MPRKCYPESNSYFHGFHKLIEHPFPLFHKILNIETFIVEAKHNQILNCKDEFTNHSNFVPYKLQPLKLYNVAKNDSIMNLIIQENKIKFQNSILKTREINENYRNN